MKTGSLGNDKGLVHAGKMGKGPIVWRRGSGMPVRAGLGS